MKPSKGLLRALSGWRDIRKTSLPLKKALLSVSVLGLPDGTKPFHLFIEFWDSKRGIASDSQALGPSSNLPVEEIRPSCQRQLYIITAMDLLVNHADKLSLGQSLTITNARMTHYLSLLLNPPKITFQAPAAISLATLSPASDLDRLLHDYSDILAHIHGIRPDLQDTPLIDDEVHL